MNGERGVGVVELMVGIVLAVIMITGMGTALYRAGQGVDTNNSRISAIREIEDAAAYLGEDVSMALLTDLVDRAAAVPSMTLQWTDYYNGGAVGHQSSYVLVTVTGTPTPPGTNLQRTYDGTPIAVAKQVKSVDFSRAGQVITATYRVCATQGSTVYPRTVTYRFYMQAQGVATPTPTPVATATSTPTPTPTPVTC